MLKIKAVLLFFKSYPLTSSFLQVRAQSPAEQMITLTSSSHLHLHLPPHPEDCLTGSRNQRQPTPVSGEFPSLTERPQQHYRIKLLPECFLPLYTQVSPLGWIWPPTSPLESDGGHPHTMWPVRTLPASLVFPVSPLSQGPSDVDVAHTVTQGMESYVKVGSLQIRLTDPNNVVIAWATPACIRSARFSWTRWTFSHSPDTVQSIKLL